MVQNMMWGSVPKTRVGTAAYISPEVRGRAAREGSGVGMLDRPWQLDTQAERLGGSARWSCFLTDARTATRAPQVARCRGDEAYDTEKADVWSCGVTLYCMLAGRYPFMDVDHQVRCASWGAIVALAGRARACTCRVALGRRLQDSPAERQLACLAAPLTKHAAANIPAPSPPHLALPYRLKKIQELAPADVDAALTKLPSDVSADCVALLRRIFSIPPAARPTLADIMAVGGGGEGLWWREWHCAAGAKGTGFPQLAGTLDDW